MQAKCVVSREIIGWLMLDLARSTASGNLCHFGITAEILLLVELLWIPSNISLAASKETMFQKTQEGENGPVHFSSNLVMKQSFIISCTICAVHDERCMLVCMMICQRNTVMIQM